MYPCYQIAVCISLLPELISLDCLNKQFIERDDSIHTGFFSYIVHLLGSERSFLKKLVSLLKGSG